MTTQNLHTPALRSSGHKEPTEEHATIAALKTRGDNGDPEQLLQNRILSSDQVGRAALYDHEDFECVAAGKKGKFDLGAEDVRKIFDGLLTYSRVGDPTAAGGAGTPPKHITLGNEGKADVENGDGDMILAAKDGKTVIAARTATLVLIVEGIEGGNKEALVGLVKSFLEGLQTLAVVVLGRSSFERREKPR